MILIFWLFSENVFLTFTEKHLTIHGSSKITFFSPIDKADKFDDVSQNQVSVEARKNLLRHVSTTTLESEFERARMKHKIFSPLEIEMGNLKALNPYGFSFID